MNKVKVTVTQTGEMDLRAFGKKLLQLADTYGEDGSVNKEQAD